MSEFETSHHLHFLFYYKTKCKFQFEIEKVANEFDVSSKPEVQSQEDIEWPFSTLTSNACV